MPLPRSWWRGQWLHRASIGWGWSRGHWWCHLHPGCIDACLHSGPRAWLVHPRMWNTKIFQYSNSYSKNHSVLIIYIFFSKKPLLFLRIHYLLCLKNSITFPPEAHSEPSGETVTVFRKPVCPMWLVFSLQLARFHTCMRILNFLFTKDFTNVLQCHTM